MTFPCYRPLGHKTKNSSENAATPGLNSHAYMHNTPADYRLIYIQQYNYHYSEVLIVMTL